MIYMTPKLTAEQRAALRASPGPILVEDEETHATYYLVESKVVEALQRERDLAAVREGLADVRAGRTISLDQLDARVRAKYGEFSGE